MPAAKARRRCRQPARRQRHAVCAARTAPVQGGTDDYRTDAAAPASDASARHRTRHASEAARRRGRLRRKRQARRQGRARDGRRQRDRARGRGRFREGRRGRRDRLPEGVGRCRADEAADRAGRPSLRGDRVRRGRPPAGTGCGGAHGRTARPARRAREQRGRAASAAWHRGRDRGTARTHVPHERVRDVFLHAGRAAAHEARRADRQHGVGDGLSRQPEAARLLVDQGRDRRVHAFAVDGAGRTRHSRERGRARADLDAADSVDVHRRAGREVRFERAAQAAGAAGRADRLLCAARVGRRELHDRADAAPERRLDRRRLTAASMQEKEKADDETSELDDRGTGRGCVRRVGARRRAGAERAARIEFACAGRRDQSIVGRGRRADREGAARR
ncbi:hypothetical protein BCEP4_1150018 [Burkholderia cepacia]|nr:hypothetical protein BCEP4_1150018 [Burkholderia cepacia]